MKIRLFHLYILWFVAVFALVFLKDGFSAENITHMLILIYFGATLALFPVIKRAKEKLGWGPKKTFVVFSVFSAAIVETFYMISKPLHASLVITPGMPFTSAIQKWAIDIILTTPFYIVLFLIIWYIINKFDYTPNQYLILFGIAQAFGDGSGFLLLNPGALAFLPYIMVNYHAMSFVPYKLIKKEIGPGSRSLLRFLIPILVIFLAYLIGGTVIFSVAKLLNLF